ncbi:hypothetical protein NST77_25870 [Niallia sp. FSL W8-0177]|uniref:hypothetical protein n=1 Tax=Niallia sp. FSL W8-0177 TaxID=2954522 RepID=UPI0030F61DD0
MTVFVETEQFNQMISYQPFVETKQEKRKVKYTLLDSIKESIGDKWDRLKEGTRQTFDMVCFFSTELGFFYASDEYLAKRNKISDRTVQYRLKELVDLGQVIKVHRRAKRCNGRGKPIYLFVNHPYFKYWVNLLGLTINCDTNCDTENPKIDWESKSEDSKNISTYVLPKKQESNIYIGNNKIVEYVVNRVNDSINKGTRIKYLSSYIDKIITKLEWQSLYAENNRQIAAKKKKHEELLANVEDILEINRPKKVPFYNWLEN